MDDFFAHLKQLGQSPANTAITLNSRGMFPIGLVGDIADFIYNAAPKPSREIALMGALGLMAAIAGRAYNVSTPPTGLNLYLLLLASTGTGKDAMRKGYELLMDVVCDPKRGGVPAASEFIGPRILNSESALIKQLQETQSFVSVLSEFGKFLATIVDKRASVHAKSLSRIFLDAWGLSGGRDILRPKIYSETIKNTKPIKSPALSLVCECTPETVLNLLDESLIADGLLPRFTIIDYRDDRSFINENAVSIPSIELIQNLSQFCTYCLESNTKTPIQVQLDNHATETLRGFRIYADNQLLGSNEVKRQLWTRAHLKAFRIAGLIAVGIDHYHPMITEYCTNIAISLEMNSVYSIQRRFDNNEVGEQATSEAAQQQKMARFIYEYLSTPWDKILESYRLNMTKEMHSKGIITYSPIQRRLGRDPSFSKSRLGSKAALKNTIDEMIKIGAMQLLPTSTMSREFNTRATGYSVTNKKQLQLTFQ